MGTGHVFPRGAHGGQWTFPDANNPDDTYIFIGKNGGGNNPGLGHEAGGDPALFIPRGPEYECQLVNPLFATSGNPNSPADVSPADFRNPFYLAGVDDQQAFSGVGTTRPIAQNGGASVPAEWLQMVPSPRSRTTGAACSTPSPGPRPPRPATSSLMSSPTTRPSSRGIPVGDIGLCGQPGQLAHL